MLVLERKTGQSVLIRTSDGDIEVCLTETFKDRVRLGFQAPAEVVILREEVGRSGGDR